MVKIDDTPVEDVNGIIDAVVAKKDEWKNVSLDDKIAFLKSIKDLANQNIEEWLALGQEARGVSPAEPQHGGARAELYLVGPGMLGGGIAHIINTLESVRDTGKPPAATNTRRVGSKTEVTVFPMGMRETIQAGGMKGQLIVDGEAEQMSWDEVHTGGVTGILGAGNFDAPTDVLGEMFIKGRVCVYKPNPVNQNTHSVIRKVFAPLVDAGYLNWIVGGGAVGGAMVNHDDVDEILLTGSAVTFDKIVWGFSAEEQAANKAKNSPKVTKPICAELGSVNPWIVVPGKWSDKQIDLHAQHLVASKCFNNGHICASPQVTVLAKDWPQREQFLERVRYWFKRQTSSPPFYPGSKESHAHFSNLDGAEVISRDNAEFENEQFPVLITGVSEDKVKDTVTQREAFCPVLSEVPLDVDPNDPMQFLAAAIEFAKTKVWGSLTCTVIIDDNSQKSNQEQFDTLLSEMPFGAVGVNIWGGFAASMHQLRWGGFPGHTAADVQSGIGYVGNTYLWKNTEKSILTAPHTFPGLTKVMTAAAAEKQFRRLADYMMNPGYWNLVKLLSAAVVGL